MPTPPCRPGERRRTARISVFADLTVQGINEQNERFKVRARSVSVSGHGGLTVLDIPVSLGQSLILVNNHSKQKAECRVVSLRPGGSGKTIVGFAFLEAPANFWKMSFPPAGARTVRRSAPAEAKAVLASSLPSKS